MKLFDVLNAITANKTELDFRSDEVKKAYNNYMINRFISFCNMYVPIVNEVNKYPDLTKDIHYRFFKNTLPQRRQFFPYIKKKNEDRQEDLEYIQKYFECSKKEAKLYLNTLPEKVVKEIVDLYKRVGIRGR